MPNVAEARADPGFQEGGGTQLRKFLPLGRSVTKRPRMAEGRGCALRVGAGVTEWVRPCGGAPAPRVQLGFHPRFF